MEEIDAAGQISFEEFAKVDIRVGKIISVEDFPKARKPAYKLLIDFGALGKKRSSAQLTKLYAKEDLQDRLVLAVVNFAPRKIADFESQVLVLGLPAPDADIVALIQPDRDLPLGAKLF